MEKKPHASQWHDSLTDISIINITETLQAADSNERWMRDYWNAAKLWVSWDLCFSSPHHLFLDSSNFLYNPKDLFWNLDSHSYQAFGALTHFSSHNRSLTSSLQQVYCSDLKDSPKKDQALSFDLPIISHQGLIKKATKSEKKEKNHTLKKIKRNHVV